MPTELTDERQSRPPRAGGVNLGGYPLALRRYGEFQGRASRAEFWHFFAVCFSGLYAVLAGAVAAILGLFVDVDWFGILMTLILLGHLIPAISVAVRRLHDVDLSGWWCLLPPAVLVLASREGTPGPNRFGEEAPALPGWAGYPTAVKSEARPQAAPRKPPAARPGAVDVIADLERLAALRAAGTLSEAEYEVMKAEALSRVGRR